MGALQSWRLRGLVVGGGVIRRPGRVGILPEVEVIEPVVRCGAAVMFNAFHIAAERGLHGGGAIFAAHIGEIRQQIEMHGVAGV